MLHRSIVILVRCRVYVTLSVRQAVSLVCQSVFFFQAEDGIRDLTVTGVQTCALPISAGRKRLARGESQKVYAGGKLWVDKQRQVIQTYEYLCHVGEAKQCCPRIWKIGRASCRGRV